MGAGSSAAGSGLIVGLCLVLLGQQFGLLDLSILLTGVVYIVAFSIGFAVVFGLIGMWLGAWYMRKHAGLTPWQPMAAGSTLPPESTESETK